MSLEIDIYGGMIQCHADQYACESLCSFECWSVRTCEHRTSFNYICIPKPKIIVVSAVILCALTIIVFTFIVAQCWRIFKYLCLGGKKIHAELARSVSDLEYRVQNPSMIVAVPSK